MDLVGTKLQGILKMKIRKTELCQEGVKIINFQGSQKGTKSVMMDTYPVIQIPL